jgi:hypothetical protein
MKRLSDDEFDCELSKINDLVGQCLAIVHSEMCLLYAHERGIHTTQEDFNKLSDELGKVENGTIPETFSQDAKEALTRLWGENSRLIWVDRKTKGPEIRKMLALIEDIVARTAPGAAASKVVVSDVSAAKPEPS